MTLSSEAEALLPGLPLQLPHWVSPELRPRSGCLANVNTANKQPRTGKDGPSTLAVMGAACPPASIPHDIPPPWPSPAVPGRIPATLSVLPPLPGSAEALPSLPVAFGWVSEARSVRLAAAQALGRSSGRAAGLLRFSCQLAPHALAPSGDEMR